MSAATLPAAMKRLDPLAGHWNTRGRTVEGVEVRGTDTYEWLGEGFLVHTVDVHMGSEKVDVIEMIGEYDPDADAYQMRAFESHGTSSVMRASVDDDGVWTFADDLTRAILTIAADGRSMAAHWDRRDGDVWTSWMDLTLTKAT